LKLFSVTHRQNLALARLARSERQREALLRLVAADSHSTDEYLTTRLGLKPRMIRKHLKVLRESGMIAVKIERHQTPKGWMNYRTAVVTEKGAEYLRKERACSMQK
jgi:transcription initiation factor IIE alpha subunit